MHDLMLHPDCDSGPISSVTAMIHPTEKGCAAEFRLSGDISAITLPDKEEAKRRDNLWKTTCFEIFWQAEGSPSYREFNLSPSTCWAAYDFDDFRLNSRDASAERVAIDCSISSNSLVLKAEIESQLVLPAKVALNAIVENADGALQFWALKFAQGKPEFHSEICRDLHLAGRL